jgi:hypothetical protein
MKINATLVVSATARGTTAPGRSTSALSRGWEGQMRVTMSRANKMRGITTIAGHCWS